MCSSSFWHSWARDPELCTSAAVHKQLSVSSAAGAAAAAAAGAAGCRSSGRSASSSSSSSSSSRAVAAALAVQGLSRTSSPDAQQMSCVICCPQGLIFTRQ